MTSKYIAILILILAPALAFGQAEKEDPFLPRNLGESVNSVYSEIKPVVSHDGQTIYFVRVDHPENRYGERGSQDIWFANLREDGSWTEAQRMPNHINMGRYNALLALSDNGNTMLINGIYNKNGTFWKKRGFSIIRKVDGEWGKPEPVKISGYDNMSKGENNDAFLSADGKTLILSFANRMNSKRQDLYISFMKTNGSWSRPRPLNGLNSKYSDESPYLSADNQTIYFASNRRSRGNYDIYKSHRLENHAWVKWSTPTLVSDTVNSYYWDSYFQTNQSGSLAYFASNNNSVGGADIFTVKLFEEHPYVAISGKILNKQTNQPVSPELNYQILANNAGIDSLIINHEESAYKAFLPLGKSYALRATIDNYKGYNTIVDATDWVEYIEVKKDLFVEPFDYVTLSGKLLIKNTNQKIPENFNPQIYINNQRIDSIKIDHNAGSYSLNLPYGQSYEIAVYTNQYEAIPEQLDLTEIKEFRQIIKNLYVEEQKTAIITGKIFDKKTGKTFPQDIPVRIDVDDAEVKMAKIDSVTREYQLELALGRSYYINAAASEYYPVTERIDVSNEREKIRIYKDLYLVPIEVGQSVRLNNIFFETGKSTLMPESFEELDRVVKFLNDNSSIKVEISGHTDNVGSSAYNKNLSNKRAQSVAEYIMLKGIPASAITYKGYGFDKPVAPNSTETGRQLNRRVEFTILDK